MAFLAWSPLGGDRRAKRILKNHSGLVDVAHQHGITVQQLALAWLLGKGENVIPLVGATRKESIDQAIAASGVRLSADVRSFLDTVWIESALLRQ